MEILGTVDFSLCGFLFAFFLILLYKYSTSTYNTWKDHGIDGPKPFPLFGNVLEMYNPNIGSRTCVMKWEAKYGRVCGIYFLRKPLLVVSDPELLKQIFVKQFHNFSDRYFVGEGKLNNRAIKKGLFFEFGIDWQRIRRIMTPTFSSGKLKQLVHYINKTANHLSDNFQKNGQNKTCIDAKDAFGAFALDTIAGLAFGLDINSQSDFDVPFIKNAKSLTTLNKLTKLKFMIGGAFPGILPLLQYFDIGFLDSQSCDYFEKSIYSLISQRKNKSDPEEYIDFLQLLLHAESEEDTHSNVSDKKLSPREVAAQSILLIIAGYETTSSALQYISYELARNKSVQTKLFEEIQEVVGDEEPNYDHTQNLKYMSQVISETLRMYPPVHLLSRKVDKACTLNGISLPANAGILIPIYNIGRDPMYFEEPDLFKPERWLNNENQSLNNITFLPFGFGPRHCIGMRFAMMEMKLALVHILRKITIEDASPEVLEIEDFSGLLAPKIPIKLSVQLR